MTEILIPTGDRHPVEEHGLVLPDGSTLTKTQIAGRSLDTGQLVRSATVKVRNKSTGREQRITLVFNEDISEAHAQDLMAQAIENTHREMEDKGKIPERTVGQRQQVGKILEDWYQHAKKRRKNTRNMLYFKGTTL